MDAVYGRRDENGFVMVRPTRRDANYVGFDPDNVADVKRFNTFRMPLTMIGDVSPMGYFAMLGDLPMMRWLYVHGAETRDVDVAVYFPMWMAATFRRVDVCEWLFNHGAAEDVKRIDLQHLSDTFLGPFRSFRAAHWLILKGALCVDDDSGDLDVELMTNSIKSQRALMRLGDEDSWLVTMSPLEWANGLHQARASFLLFLSGVRSAQQHVQNTHRAVSAMNVLGGKPGIRKLIFDFTGVVCGREVGLLRGKSKVLKLIGDYVGFVRGLHGREARIIHQLTTVLPDLLEQLEDEDVETSEDEEEDEE